MPLGILRNIHPKSEVLLQQYRTIWSILKADNSFKHIRQQRSIDSPSHVPVHIQTHTWKDCIHIKESFAT